MVVTSRRLAVVSVIVSAAGAQWVSAQGASPEEITVIGITPTESTGLSRDRIAAHVQRATADDLRRGQSLDLTEFMARGIGSVSINSAQGNPLQPDVQLRGFTASPLLGLPQGLAVYQDGARANEPLGDAVNWDLIPQSAIHAVNVISGASPLFGLNTLGGALAIDMKNGFSDPGHALELGGGSWDRFTFNAQSGGNDGTFGYYANVQYFEEDGWRDLSASTALIAYGALSWRASHSSLDLGLHLGDSKLRGNGTSPIGLLDEDRGAIFTAPDITRNDLVMVTVEGTHDLNAELEIAASAFHRSGDTESFNGDASEFLACNLGNGPRLLDGLEDDELLELGLDDDDLCDGTSHADAGALQDYLNLLAGGPMFDLEDLTPDLSGSGVLRDEAINNRSSRSQTSQGLDVQIVSRRQVLGRDNHLIGGAAVHEGRSRFQSSVELSGMDPETRSTEGLGAGTFVDDEASDLTTRSRSYSVYFSDTWSLTEALGITVAGRWNSTRIRLRDRSGERPELDGDHQFDRFNPALGFTWQAGERLNIYGSYAMSSRAPTPIELSCNEVTFERASQLALERGEDPDDIDFECRLPNAFVADPPLEQVVARGFEFGMRGRFGNHTDYHLGAFHITNRNDIVFQTTGRATGLFANVDRTRRSGIEATLGGRTGPLEWFGAISYIDARFADEFSVSSPNHPLADAAGEIAVERGDRIPGIPRINLKFGADYALTEAFEVGADVIYNSGQSLRGDEANELDPVSGHALLNLHARYRVTDHIELFGRIDNVLDERYENFGLVGEDPTEVIDDLNDATPFYLGPGAPRAAWIGVRFSQ